jgi:hypothetical protein
MVQQMYFGLPLSYTKAKTDPGSKRPEENGQSRKEENRFRFTTFDQLISPLRVDNPFGKQLKVTLRALVPKGDRPVRNLHLHVRQELLPLLDLRKAFVASLQIKSKSEKEIIDFYQVWKKTSSYKCWKSKQDKRRVTSNQNEWVFQ